MQMEQCSQRQLWEPRWEVAVRVQSVASREQPDMMTMFCSISSIIIIIIIISSIIDHCGTIFFIFNQFCVFIFYSNFLEVEEQEDFSGFTSFPG